LVDVYDALRSDRPYKEAFPHETACRIIREGNGTHFDPSVVDAFFAVEQEFEQICDHMTNEGAEGIL
ncbi:MAG TPA: two-component system response regulator, partial [Aminobacteriaceae bacterium]|nr:two-component system response regulator [Aminobacteriaceae bacterium]